MTWQTIAGKFADGTPYELRKPVVALNGLRDGALSSSTHLSARIPRPVFGLGLIEAVPAETIVALADPDDVDGDGISGRPNWVKDPRTGAEVLGRFGWKAGVATLREQAALAFVNDIGVTSPLFPKHRCGAGQTTCLASVASATAPQLNDTDLDHIQSYLRGLSVPPRRNYEDTQAVRGKALFQALGCPQCHVPNLVTSSTYEVPELRNIDIQPFTDLLLHDMGDGLADDAPIEEGSASGREWRTCPLWGNGTGAAVMYPAIDAFDPNGHPPPGGVYLHDGRARSITEAILWHGGEAQPMRDAFVAMDSASRCGGACVCGLSVCGSGAGESLHDLALAVGLRAGDQKRLYGRGVDGLGQVVIESGFRGSAFIRCLTEAGGGHQEHLPNAVARAQPSSDFQTTHLWQIQVQKDDLVRIAQRGVERG